MSNLEDLTDEIDAICEDELGETITYAWQGRALPAFKAHVFYADAQTDIGAGQGIEQDMTLHIRKVRLPGEPTATDRIQLRRHPGKTYRPTNPSTDDSGTHWTVALKLVR